MRFNLQMIFLENTCFFFEKSMLDFQFLSTVAGDLLVSDIPTRSGD